LNDRSIFDGSLTFVGFRVLELFLTHPSLEIHLNELARELEIAREVQELLRCLVDEG